jgi:hypothetical protein
MVDAGVGEGGEGGADKETWGTESIGQKISAAESLDLVDSLAEV